MSFNLRNRSLLTVQDYTQREFQLPARPRARPEARQVRAHRAAAPEGQGDLPDLREDLDAHPLRLRGRLLTTRARTSPTSTRAGSQIGHKESVKDTARVLGPHVRRDRVPRRVAGRRRASWPSTPGVPVYNGLTDEYHPTQMLADVMTMREHSDKPIARDQVRLSRRHALQHGPLADDRRLPDGHGRAHLRARRRCGRPTST